MSINIGLYINCIVMFFLALWLSISYQKSKLSSVKYFAIFFWLKTVFMVFLTLGFIGLFSITTRAFFMNISLGILHFTLIPLVLFACHLWAPESKRKVAGIFLAGAAVVFTISLITLSPPAQITATNLNKTIGLLNLFYAIFSHLIGMVAIGITIFFKSLKLIDKRLMIRGIFLGIGMFGAGIFGPLIFAMSQVSQVTALSMVTFLAHFLIAIGAITGYSVEKEKYFVKVK